MTLIAFKMFLVLLLCIPAVILAIGNSKHGRNMYSLLLILTSLIGATVAFHCWSSGVRVGLGLSGFAPIPFALQIDRLSAFFLFLMCVVAAPVFLFSSSYVDRHYEGARRKLLWVLLPLFLLSMVVVVTASSAFSFLFGWELMTLLSAGLIVIDGDSKERR